MNLPPTSTARRRAGIALALGLAGAAAADEAPIVLKFSHVLSADSPKGRAAQRFKALAEQRSAGRVRVEVYPDSRLYKDKEEIEALQLGVVQMLAPTLPKFGPLGLREFEAFELPYLFKDLDAVRAVTEGPLGRAFLDKLRPHGLLGLGYWINGFQIYSATRPLHTLNDFRGLRMRIQSSKVWSSILHTLGAQPQVLSFAALPQALRRGVVDGCDAVPSDYAVEHLYELQPHMTLSSHTVLAYAVIVNQQFWSHLPDDLRALLERALRDAGAYASEVAAQQNVQTLELIRASGKVQVHELPPHQLAHWQRELRSLHAGFEPRIGSRTLREVYRAAGFVAA